MLPVLLRIFSLIGAMSVFLTITAVTWSLAAWLNPKLNYRTHIITAMLWPMSLPTLLLMLVCEKLLADE